MLRDLEERAAAAAARTCTRSVVRKRKDPWAEGERYRAVCGEPATMEHEGEPVCLEHGPPVAVRLYYPPYKFRGKPKGHAEGLARITRTQIVVESARVLDGDVLLGGLPLRFHRKTWRPVGRWAVGWRLEAFEACPDSECGVCHVCQERHRTSEHTARG